MISDNTNGIKNWNTGSSQAPTLAVDGSGNIHVAWADETNLEGCGTDDDIFYSNFSVTTGKWSHAKVISDNTNGNINWNTEFSYAPTLAIDNSGNIHIAWQDMTNLEECGSDTDIFYSNFSVATEQWSHPTVISDNTNGTLNWNLGYSGSPTLAVDGSGNVHVAWIDDTNLEGCGIDIDIFYANCSIATGQRSHPVVISDNINGTVNWNTGTSAMPTLTVDDLGNVHIAWMDETNLEGCGSDMDIFYANFSTSTGQCSHAKVISDNSNGTTNWNTGFSFSPSLSLDDLGNVHITWSDETNLEECGTDFDIFYARIVIQYDDEGPDYTGIILIIIIVLGIISVVGITGIIYWKKKKKFHEKS